MQTWIITHSQRRFDFANPRAEDIDLADISVSLAYQNRYTGHAGAYSVASHSLFVARIVRTVLHRPDLELEALLHDAHEAYVGDVSAPLKSLLPDYQAMEDQVERLVRAKFGLTSTLHPTVREADLLALHDELLTFFGLVVDGQRSGLAPVGWRMPMEARKEWENAVLRCLAERAESATPTREAAEAASRLIGGAS